MSGILPNVALRTAVLGGALLRPRLDLKFTEALNSKIAFTRASNAAFFNRDGILQIVADDIARIGANAFDSINWINRGFLIEEARTNLFLRSTLYSNAYWTRTDIAVVDNNEIGPDGTMSASTLSESAPSGIGSLSRNFIVSSNLDVYVVAWFIKKTSGATNFPGMSIFYSGGTNKEGGLILNTNNGNAFENDGWGNAGAVKNFGVIDAGDYWRAWWSVANNSSGNTSMKPFFNPAANINGTDGTRTTSAQGSTVLANGQVELAEFPSSYNFSTTSAGVRAEEAANMDITNLFGSKFTWYIRGFTAVGSGAQVFGQIDDGGGTPQNNSVRIERNSSNEIHLIVNDGGVEQANINLGVVANKTSFQAIVRVAANDFQGALNGTLATPDTSGAVPAGLVDKYIGKSDSGDQCGGFIARDTMWSRSLSNGAMQRETS